jgi:hypothetical protein
MDEHARFHVTPVIDMQVSAASYAASRNRPIAPKIGQYDRFVSP